MVAAVASIIATGLQFVSMDRLVAISSVLQLQAISRVHSRDHHSKAKPSATDALLS